MSDKPAMSAIDPKAAAGGGRLVWAGGILSVAYLTIIGILFRAKLAQLGEMELNLVGDFLAGTFAPLAFLWLVLGYFQQQRELRLNTTALLLQHEELRQSVQHQGDLVKVARQQLEEQQQEQEAKLREALPRFVAGDVRYEVANDIGNVEDGHVVQLINVGAAISEITMRANQEVTHFSPERLDTWIHNRAYEMRWGYPGSRPIEGYTFTITFVDRYGRTGATELAVVPRTDAGPFDAFINIAPIRVVEA